MKEYTLEKLPVGLTEDVVLKHRVLVNSSDKEAGFLLDKQVNTTRMGFAEDSKNEGKFVILLDKDNPEDETVGSNPTRTITTFNIQDNNSTVTGLNGSQYSSTVILYPITIATGKIRNIALFPVNVTDVENMDRIQIAILSNTKNNLAGSKLEFLAQYGFSDELDNMEYTGDYKTFDIKETSKFNTIADAACSFHFVAVFLHVRTDIPGGSSMGVLAKDKSFSPLVEIGKNMNYCGQDSNRTTLLRKDFIDPDTYTVSEDYVIGTNLQNNFPYIEFYQARGS